MTDIGESLIGVSIRGGCSSVGVLRGVASFLPYSTPTFGVRCAVHLPLLAGQALHRLYLGLAFLWETAPWMWTLLGFRGHFELTRHSDHGDQSEAGQLCCENPGAGRSRHSPLSTVWKGPVHWKGSMSTGRGILSPQQLEWNGACQVMPHRVCSSRRLRVECRSCLPWRRLAETVSVTLAKQTETAKQTGWNLTTSQKTQ